MKGTCTLAAMLWLAGIAAACAQASPTPGMGTTSPLGTTLSEPSSSSTSGGIPLGATELSPPGLSPLQMPCPNVTSNAAFDGGGSTASSACGSAATGSSPAASTASSANSSSSEIDHGIDRRFGHSSRRHRPRNARRESGRRRPQHDRSPLPVNVVCNGGHIDDDRSERNRFRRRVLDRLQQGSPHAQRSRGSDCPVDRDRRGWSGLVAPVQGRADPGGTAACRRRWSAAAVAAHPVPIYLRGVGTVIAFNNVVVRSQITGPLIKISFRQGQTVHKGDVLAEIDPRPYQAQLDQAIANRDRDQAQLANAQANLDRYVPLQSKGFATGQLVDTQKAQVAQMQATVKADQAVIENAQVNLELHQADRADRRRHRDPADRRGQHHPSDRYQRSGRPHPDPADLADLHAAADDIPRNPARDGQRARSRFSPTARTTRPELDEGELLLIDNQINQTTGTIRLRATFPNAQRLLWPGELVNARLLLRTEPDGLTIAAGAVQQGPNGSYVYVIDAGPVGAGAPGARSPQISEGQALIDSGLKADETVVVDGQYRLQPGTHVQDPARQGRAAGRHAERGPAGDPVNISGALHPAAGRDIAVDGGPVAVRPRRLPPAAGRGAAQRRLSDHSDQRAIARRRSANHGILGCDAAGTAVEPDPRPDAADVIERARLRAVDRCNSS